MNHEILWNFFLHNSEIANEFVLNKFCYTDNLNNTELGDQASILSNPKMMLNQYGTSPTINNDKIMCESTEHSEVEDVGGN